MLQAGQAGEGGGRAPRGARPGITPSDRTRMSVHA